MSYSTVTIMAEVTPASGWTFSNSNVFSITISTSSYADATTYVQNAYKIGGFWATDTSNNQVWLPVSAINRIVIS